MSGIVLLSILALLVALARSVVLQLRVRDWRVGSLVSMLALLLLVQFLILLAHADSFSIRFAFETSELLGPVVSVMALFAVAFVERVVAERQQAEEAIGRLEKAVETMQLGVTITDIKGKILHVNSADAQLHGYEPEELIGKEVSIYGVPGSKKPLSVPEIEEMRSWTRETVNRRKDGTTFSVYLMSDVVRGRAGEPIGVVTTCEDITQRKLSEEALLESEERYALAARGANDGLWDWNLRTDTIYLSPRWKSILGYEEHEIASTPDEWMNRVHRDDIQQLKTDLDAHLEGRSPHFENEHRLRHRDGTYRWVLSRALAVRDGEGKTYRLTGSMADITERKGTEEQLLHDALHDELTGLPNRAFFLSLLERSMKRADRRRDYLFAVLFLDLDRFKLVNDSLGHAMGDDLLVAFSKRLQGSLRPGDLVARLGGDEFVVLLDDLRDATDATRVAERVQADLRSPFNLGSGDVFASASVGIALSQPRRAHPDDHLRDADTAMYRAKARGRAGYVVFDEEMHARAVAMLQLETDLRLAVERAEFRVHYQPIVSLKDGQIIGFESLLRWQHPERGLVLPDEFVSILEETGLIVVVGLWVMQVACRQARAWQEQVPRHRDLSISVNLSAKQFQQPDLVQQVTDILNQTGLSPTSLKLEITESLLMEDPEAKVEVIEELRSAGVRVQIDDFGTGYSSLSYLQRFTFDTLKIDRSFVSQLGNRTDIVATIISLARGLGVNVIAEGVETEEQTARLGELNCEHAQGFLFREPVDPKAAGELLTSRWRADVGVTSRQHRS